MDSRRRGSQKRPAQSEAHAVWGQLTTSIGRINESQTSQTLADDIIKVNRYLNEIDSAVAVDDFTTFDRLQGKLRVLLEQIKRTTEEHNDVMKDTIEKLSVLKGIRGADEEARVQAVNDKRINSNKRQKMSPAATSSQRTASSPPLVQTATRGAAQASAPVGRPKKNTALPPAQQLREGRDVAFRHDKGDGDAEWILAKIVKVVDAHSFIVQDVDPSPGAQDKFPATLKNIVPLPDIEAPNAWQGYPVYPKHTRVIAQYPDTTSFYPAQIISGRHQPSPLIKYETYSLEFDDDEGQEKKVPAHRVVVVPPS
ncbi:SGF29 tudor-like domain-containing protein [Auriculariales sp. MPI-PUGE-AT-0066]|nr:SGF29 tudor-like domain-containing protein [Auriculariales sp. MPI-PUGE-AT-0066]